MTPSQLQQLEELAKKLVCGSWLPLEEVWAVDHYIFRVDHNVSRDDFEFINKLSPSIVLDLIARIRELEN
jgi:hypothetical protein